MSVQTVTLACPSCGNASHLEAKRVRFGYEFTCPFCSATSVMIVDKQLYVPKDGEVICFNCGTVNPQGAKFCSCGTALVRRCLYCQEAYPADSDRCTHCGRLQSLPSNSAERQALVKDAIERLGSQVATERAQACDELRRLAAAEALPALLTALQAEKNSQVRTAMCKVLTAVNPGKQAVPLLLTLLQNDFNAEVREAVCQALAAIGPEAAEAIPQLCNTLNDESEDVNVRVQICHALFTIGKNATTISALQSAVRASGSPQVQRAAGEVLVQLQPNAAESAFTDVLRNEQAEVVARQAAFEMLRQLDSTRALNVIRELVRHPKRADVDKQSAEVMQIQYVKQEGDYEGLAKLLADLNAHAAGEIFSEVLEDKHIDLRFKRVICKLLVETPAEREKSISVLVGWLRDKDTDEIAYQALARIGMPALPTLKKFVGQIVMGGNEKTAQNLIDQIERAG